MKRGIRLIMIFITLSLLASDCSLFEDCANCSLVTLVDGVETSRTPGVPYCGDKLDEKRNADPVVIGNRTTYWDCE
jgi:hypothetical protein